MPEIDIDRPRYVFACLMALQPVVTALIKTHPDRDALRVAFSQWSDLYAAQLLNSGLEERDVAGFHEQTKVLAAAIGEASPRPPSRQGSR